MSIKESVGVVPIIVLVVVASLFGLFLSLTNFATADQIEQNALESANESRRALFQNADDFEQVDVTSISESKAPGLTEAYKAISDGETIGYVFQAQNRGYSADVPAMIGIDSEGEIVGIEVLRHEETPGLGDKVEEDSFLSQYYEKTTDQNFSVNRAHTPEDQVIDGVTGATLSSNAINGDVNDAAHAYNELSAEGSE